MLESAKTLCMVWGGFLSISAAVAGNTHQSAHDKGWAASPLRPQARPLFGSGAAWRLPSPAIFTSIHTCKRHWRRTLPQRTAVFRQHTVCCQRSRRQTWFGGLHRRWHCPIGQVVCSSFVGSCDYRSSRLWFWRCSALCGGCQLWQKCLLGNEVRLMECGGLLCLRGRYMRSGLPAIGVVVDYLRLVCPYFAWFRVDAFSIRRGPLRVVPHHSSTVLSLY